MDYSLPPSQPTPTLGNLPTWPTVSYGYTLTNGQQLLTSVTTPGGKETFYGYGGAITNTGWTGNTWYGDVASNLLTSINDPRGLVTSMQYVMASPSVLPYGGGVPEAVMCYQENNPNGTTLAVLNPIYSNEYGETTPELEMPAFKLTGTSTGEFISAGVNVSIGVSSPVVWTGIQSWYGTYNNFGNDWCTTFYENTEYDATTQNQLQDNLWTYPKSAGWDLAKFRDIPGPSWADQYVQTSTVYNWMGNPLSKTVDEHEDEPNNSYTDHTSSVGYAYWGSTKYYQQKATLDQAGRYTYSDYYPSTAAAGSRGQQEYVYDPKNCAFYLNTGIAPPAGTPSSEYWRYQLQPVNAADYTATFVYDSYGRATDAYKLQGISGGTYSYVQTHTTYGSNTDGSWGQAATVAEDYGGINRVTQTKNYTAWGKADDTVDAAGHEFVTSYDQDGNIQSITRTDGGLNEAIVTYAYGSSPGVSYGQVVGVTDGLSGVVDTVTYQSSGMGTGQVSQVSESGGSNPNYTVGYTFDPLAQRSKVTYTTSNGTWRWLYEDYSQVGVPTKLQMAFRTLDLLDSSSNPTSEEMHYTYDSTGRLQNACFAQTPASGYNPGTGGDYYTSSEEASSRCRAAYDYDPAGRTRSVNHWWETYLGSGNYSEEAVFGNTCEYELTGLNRGLKTESDFYQNTAQGSSAWTLNHSETYSYDSSLDYLTGANYGDGLANATPSWSYDAAGNRSDSVVDNLNRSTSVGGVSTGSDILGNRLTLGSSTSYGWDCLNRLTTYQDSTGTSTYAYRADGMRVGKSVGSTGTTTIYCYDGQMGFEDTDSSGTQTTVTDYGLGARGIDYISAHSGSTTVGFPIYDAHGNMVACLERSGSGYYSVSNERSYNAWGLVRQGASTGDPKGSYCASLGHKHDDESNLIYMRSRYCEPTSGRFLSEDPKASGINWFIYCSGDPINRVDNNGKSDALEDILAVLGMYFAIGAVAHFSGGDVPMAMLSAKVAVLCFALLFAEDDYTNNSGLTGGQKAGVALGGIVFMLGLFTQGIQMPTWLGGVLDASVADAAAGSKGLAQVAVMGVFAYSLAVCGALIDADS